MLSTPIDDFLMYTSSSRLLVLGNFLLKIFLSFGSRFRDIEFPQDVLAFFVLFLRPQQSFSESFFFV